MWGHEPLDFTPARLIAQPRLQILKDGFDLDDESSFVKLARRVQISLVRRKPDGQQSSGFSPSNQRGPVDSKSRNDVGFGKEGSCELRATPCRNNLDVFAGQFARIHVSEGWLLIIPHALRPVAAAGEIALPDAQNKKGHFSRLTSH